MPLKLIRKLSPKTVSGVKKGVVTPEKPSVLLFKAIGIARGFTTGESNFGPWVRFTGDFMALTPDEAGKFDKTRGFRAPGIHLPEPFQGMLLAQIQEAEKANADEKAAAADAKRPANLSPVAIEFVVNVFVKYDEKSSTNYVYECEPIVQRVQSDALDRLAAMEGSKLLPGGEVAPDEDEEIEVDETDHKGNKTGRKVKQKKGKGRK